MTILGRRSALALSGIILLFVLVLHGRWSPGSLGFFHDDSLYFSSARSLASGAGYTMSSVPGEPAQTKYPVFYPWLLSLIWRVWPVFPGNLYPAFWLSVLAGCAFVGGGFCSVEAIGDAGEASARSLLPHCCPVKSRIESIGWGHRGIRFGSRMAGVPVKGAFFRIA